MDMGDHARMRDAANASIGAGTDDDRRTNRDPIRVLFVCTGNSARSQMAEAILGRLGGGDFVAFSAGTEPTGVHPLTIRVLAESGIDWSGASSKPVTEVLDRSFDRVITVCDAARQACPVLPGGHATDHWDIEDPAAVEGAEEVRLEAFRRTLDEISERVRQLIRASHPPGTPRRNP
jgi:arsenate reductase (thioredoxin)